MGDIKARPILFSAPMVRALLEGRKTQTRRILKDVPEAPGIDEVVHANPKHAAPYLDAYCGGRRTPENPRGMTQWWCWWTRDDRPCEQFKIPYGVPGDFLWVRESWHLVHVGGGRGGGIDPFNSYDEIYLADGHSKHFTFEGDDDPFLRFASDRPRPSMFMPRWASRLTLEITDVRVERLQDISETDAIAEGCGDYARSFPKDDPIHETQSRLMWPERAYRVLWEQINGPGSWDANPWVVALSFKVHRRNVDAMIAKQLEPTDA